VTVGSNANATPARDEWVARANALFRAMAREEGATLVDLHAALQAAGPAKTLFADGVHRNDAAYAVSARACREALTNQTPAPPASSLKALRFGRLWDGAG